MTKTIQKRNSYLSVQLELTNLLLRENVDSDAYNADELSKSVIQIENVLQEKLNLEAFKLERQIASIENAIIGLFEVFSSLKPVVLVEDSPHVYNFFGVDIVNRLRVAGYNAWSILNCQRASSHFHLQTDISLLEKLTSVSLVLCSTIDLSDTFSNKLVKETNLYPGSKAYFYAQPRGIVLRRNQRTKLLRIPISASSHVGEQCLFDSDFIFVQNENYASKILNKYRMALPLPKDLVWHRRKVTAIPLGNLKVHRARKRLKELQHTETKFILFFVGPYDVPASLGEKRLCNLITDVLDNIQDAKVVFRPHPAWVDHKRTLGLCNFFREESRFIFDDNMTSEEMIIRGSAIITDNSNSALTFSLIHLQPGIYVNPTIPTFDEVALNLRFCDGAIFKFCDTNRDVIRVLKKQLNNPVKTHIDEESVFYNSFAHLHDGEEYFFKVIRSIIYGQELNDWQTLKISENDLSNDVRLSYEGLFEHDIVNFPAYPSHISVDLDTLSERAKSKIFLKCASGTEHHSTYLVNLLPWILRNIADFGFSRLKGLLLSAVVRSLSRMPGSFDELSTKELIKRRPLGGNNDGEAHEWILPIIEAFDSAAILEEVTRKQISGYLDENEMSCEIFWRNFVEQSREKEGHTVALFGAGNYSKHLLEHVLIKEFRPDFLIETKPIIKHLIVDDGTEAIDIVSLDQIKAFCGSIIIASSVFEQEIQTKLRSLDFLGSDVEIINPFQIADTYFPLTLWH